MDERKLWFKAKTYGWGWQPCTWQGWFTLFIYVAILILEIRKIDVTSKSASDVLINFSIPFILITILFLFLAWGTGERPRWRWGKD